MKLLTKIKNKFLLFIQFQLDFRAGVSDKGVWVIDLCITNELQDSEEIEEKPRAIGFYIDKPDEDHTTTYHKTRNTQ